MKKKLDDKLDPKAKGHQTGQTDFDRNRDGVYGGLPRSRGAETPDAEVPEPKPRTPRPMP